MATISFIFWICYAFITGKRKAKPDETRKANKTKKGRLTIKSQALK